MSSKIPLDVLFINPNCLDKVYGKMYKEIMTTEPPLWAMMLSGALKSKGIRTHIIDTVSHNLDKKGLVAAISQYEPTLIVIAIYGQHPSASTHTMYGAKITTKIIKEHSHKTKVLFVGGHVSAIPEKTLQEEPCDFVAKGEGLETIIELLKVDLNNSEQLSRVPGLFFWENKKILHGPPNLTKMDTSLDNTYPRLDFESINFNLYRAPNWFLYGNLQGRKTYASLYTSLGCPFQCSFCCINAPFSKKVYRTWSKENIIDTLDCFHFKGVKNLKIADELFILKEDHYVPICEELVGRKYNFNIWAFARVDTINERYLPLLKKAGINWLILGIESYSNRIRKGIHKSQYEQEKIIEIVKSIQKSGIYIHANFMFGLPEDTIETMQENLNFALKLNVETANFYCLMPYPGSMLYERSVETNNESPRSWIEYAQHSEFTRPLPSKYLTGREILTFRDQAWHIFHEDKNYLNSMQEKFGSETREYIESISKVKLKRRYALDVQLAKPV